MIRTIRVADDFPLSYGEVLRIKMPTNAGQGGEVRVRVEGLHHDLKIPGVTLRYARERWYPGPGTNKSPVSILSDPTRKPDSDRGPRNPKGGRWGWQEEDEEN